MERRKNVTLGAGYFFANLSNFFMVDGLTFCWVRRCYKLFYRVMIWSKGYLIFIDLDNFQEINTQFGHKARDKVLRKLGIIFLKESRFRAFRYGGDEFMILLPFTSQEKAISLAEKIREGVEKSKSGLTVTCAVAKQEESTCNLLMETKRSSEKNKVIVLSEET